MNKTEAFFQECVERVESYPGSELAHTATKFRLFWNCRSINSL